MRNQRVGGGGRTVVSPPPRRNCNWRARWGPRHVCTCAEKNANERVLVLEGDSRVGVQVIRTLRENKKDMAVSATISGLSDEKRIQRLRSLEIETFQTDKLGAKHASDILTSCKPDVIVSCISEESDNSVGSIHPKVEAFVDAAVGSGARRFVLLSSIGAGSSEQALPGPAKETMKPIMSDKYIAEKYLAKHSDGTGLQYVVLRSSPLNDDVDDTYIGHPIVTDSPVAYGLITVSGLAHLVSQVIGSDRAVGGTFSAVDLRTVFITNPFLRPLEVHETVPFQAFEL